MLTFTFLSFFFNVRATTELYTLSLHDALPIFVEVGKHDLRAAMASRDGYTVCVARGRSEEHTSELQSRQYLVCRLLLEKKKRFGKSLRLTMACLLNV